MREQDCDPDLWSAAWALSGSAGLSGRADGPPLDVSEGVVRMAATAAATIRDLTQRSGRVVDVDGPALLGERAALAGLSRRGDTSCGGATRLLRAADGWIALSLARDADVESLPAWLDGASLPAAADEELWDTVGALVAGRAGGELVARAVLLGMPVAELGEARVAGPAALCRRVDGAVVDKPFGDLLVVDLSSLWAGPLCANLLGLAGARVIKVESEHRPDGARNGTPRFFDLLHGGHESVCLDFRSDRHLASLQRLLSSADIVIEASRPRALAQLGLDSARTTGPRIWLSITAHGAAGAGARRVGFGDDAAVAGGLVAADADGPCFAVDAVADPLSGLAAAGAVVECLDAGGRWKIDVALSRTAALASGGPLTDIAPFSLAMPRSRHVVAAAPAVGQHTASVLAELC